MAKFVSLFILLMISFSSFAVTSEAVVGKWHTPEGKSKIEIYRCGQRYCGKIVWLKEPNYPSTDKEAGMPKRDRENPIEKLRSRTILGLPLMSDFQFDGDDQWIDGLIYDPESGKTYDCKMTLSNSNTLKVRGYIGFSLIGRTSIWTRD